MIRIEARIDKIHSQIGSPIIQTDQFVRLVLTYLVLNHSVMSDSL